MDGPNHTGSWAGRTFSKPRDLTEITQLKRRGGVRLSVVLPALDEADSIGPICRLLTGLKDAGLIDELVVVDSGSTDGTAELARAAGATVHLASELTDQGPVLGKGDCLWRSLTVITGDVVVWLDSDTRNMHEGFVVDLVAPLLDDRGFVMTKAFYDRPLVTDAEILATGGARVTELVARPLFQLFYPELVGLIQPLAGEYAGFTDVFREVPFFTGYGVEVGLLLDVAERAGIEAIAQVDLGVRVHRNRSVLDLGATAFQVMTAALRRLDDLGRIKLPVELPKQLLQFEPTPSGPSARVRDLEIVERPPIKDLY